jgi:hypothetical protein
MRRWDGGWFAAGLTVLVLTAVALPAAASPCPGTDGVTVVVDFGSLGGGVSTGCAPAPGTGFDALSQAGFAVTPVQTNPAFVCRIDGRPEEGQEDCVDIPPATGFWSYWTAVRGGDWRLAATGAAGAVAGDLEGWSFSTGTTTPPAFPVPAASDTTTTTSTTSTTSTTTTTITTTGPPTTTASSPTTTTAAPSTTTTSTASTTTTTAPPTTSPSTTTTATSSTTTTSLPTTSAPETTLSAAGEAGPGAGGFVAGAAVVAAVGAMGVVMARRRTDRP